jgi:hypothetical protein
VAYSCNERKEKRWKKREEREIKEKKEKKRKRQNFKWVLFVHQYDATSCPCGVSHQRHVGF